LFRMIAFVFNQSSIFCGEILYDPSMSMKRGYALWAMISLLDAINESGVVKTIECG